MFWAFKLSFVVDILAFFDFVTFLAIFSNLLVTLLLTNVEIRQTAKISTRGRDGTPNWAQYYKTFHGLYLPMFTIS